MIITAGLSKSRMESPALRKCHPEEICFDYYGDPLLLSFLCQRQFYRRYV
jgi:hypothetical protein